MRRRIAIFLYVIAALVAAAGGLSSSSSAQRRVFSHNTPAHKQGKYSDCSSCHALPTKNWTAARPDKLSPFPDVATYPSHTACFTCHSNDKFVNGGAFCGNCHTVPSMRARAVLPFPLQSHATQFTTRFPHNVHQDIIAANPEKPDYAVAHFITASFYRAPLQTSGYSDDKAKPTFYNCAICHAAPEQTPKYTARKLLGQELKPLGGVVADTFERPVAAQFFKTSPEGHESCFTCHYQFKNLPVGKQSCAGCHELSTPYFEKSVVRRYSLKFDHQRDGHTGDCTSCHLRITQNSDARTMKDADVPILTCKGCHATQEDVPFRRVLTAEIESREANKTFQCTYCHTSEIGRFETPASHRK